MRSLKGSRLQRRGNNVKNWKKEKGRSQLGAIWFRYKKNKLALIGLILMTIILIVVLTANLYIPEERISKMDISNMYAPISSSHLLGTDQYGRDVLARVIYGGRISLKVGIFVVLGAMTIGGLLGACAGYFGGVVENIIMRVMDIFLAIPSMILSITVVAALGTSTTNLIIALIIARTPQFARIVRSAVLPLKNQEYIEAALACGTSHWRIITRHIIPNVIGPVIVQATLQMGGAIINIAGLSFIGLGVQPPTPEWGSMLSEAREVIRVYPYLVFPPGLAIMVSVFSFNRIGDGLRDALDPKLKN